jgi:hypothetical protein
MKRYWLILLFGLILAACSSSLVSTPAPTVGASSAAASSVAGGLTQTNDEAMVTVAVTPLNLDDKSAATLDFEIALNTHSVELAYDLTQIATSNDTVVGRQMERSWGRTSS